MIVKLPLVAFVALVGLLTSCAPAPTAPSSSSARVGAAPVAFPVIYKIDAVLNAKRVPPAAVVSVTANGVRYAVPHFRTASPGMTHNGGYVEAVDEKTGTRMWLKEIFRYAVDGSLEGDVQDVFIVRLEVDGASLKIRDEQGAEYQLALPP